LFYYDVANGFDYDYYNSSRSYTPVFDIQPTPQQEDEARQVCTVDGEFNTACAYDYYATGNAHASGVAANANSHYVAARKMRGLFIKLLASCILCVRYVLCWLERDKLFIVIVVITILFHDLLVAAISQHGVWSELTSHNYFFSGTSLCCPVKQGHDFAVKRSRK